MNLYRVAYYHVTGRQVEVDPHTGYQHKQRTGHEKVAFVVAETEQQAAEAISTPDDEVTGVTVEKKDIVVASSPKQVDPPVTAKRRPTLADMLREEGPDGAD